MKRSIKVPTHNEDKNESVLKQSKHIIELLDTHENKFKKGRRKQNC